MAKKKMACCSGSMKKYIIPEAAFYAAAYYLLDILGVQGNIWAKALVLFVLINIAVFTCPLMKECAN